VEPEGDRAKRRGGLEGETGLSDLNILPSVRPQQDQGQTPASEQPKEG
jgi:hypothetical protein